MAVEMGLGGTLSRDRRGGSRRSRRDSSRRVVGGRCSSGGLLRWCGRGGNGRSKRVGGRLLRCGDLWCERRWRARISLRNTSGLTSLIPCGKERDGRRILSIDHIPSRLLIVYFRPLAVMVDAACVARDSKWKVVGDRVRTPTVLPDRVSRLIRYDW